MKYSHTIHKDDEGIYRCSTCRRASRSRAILEDGVPCSSPRQPEKGEKDRGPVWQYTNGIEPTFPDLGDVWNELGTNDYYIWARAMGAGQAPGWVDLTTGLFKPGQLSFSGNGINPQVRTYKVTTSVSQEFLARGDDRVITNQTLAQTWAAVLGEMLEEWAVPIGESDLSIGLDRTTDAKTFTVSILGRPLPTGFECAWHDYVRILNMQYLPASFTV